MRQCDSGVVVVELDDDGALRQAVEAAVLVDLETLGAKGVPCAAMAIAKQFAGRCGLLAAGEGSRLR